jgi:hypothetical protein
LENYDSIVRLSKNYFIESPNYFNLSPLLKNQKKNFYKNDDDDNNNKQNMDGIIVRRKEQLPPTNERFFLFNMPRPKYGSRPSKSYGPKSHWDTFFG